jgi:hypothetical protein
MSVENRVFNKLFKESKTELSAKKIELALVDGLERSLDKIYNDIERVSGILNKAGNDAESISKNISLKVNGAMDSVKKAENMSKELGVDVPEIKQLKQRLQKAEQRAKELIKRATSVQ